MPNRMPSNNWIRSISNVGKQKRTSAAESQLKASSARDSCAGFQFRKGIARYELQKPDPIGLLCMAIQAEASNVAQAVAVLEDEKIHLTHMTVSDFYSLVGESVWIIESLVKCIFDVALKNLKTMSAERKEARNADFLAALEYLESVSDSQMAFDNSSLPPGERFIVIQRARDILSIDLMKSLAEIDQEARESEQQFRAHGEGNIEVDVYNALVEYMRYANKTKRRVGDVAAGVLTQWMNDTELQRFAKQLVGVLSGSRLSSLRGCFLDEKIKGQYVLKVSVNSGKGVNPVENNGRIGPDIARQLNAIAVERLKIVANAGVSEAELARVTADPNIVKTQEREEAAGDRARPEKLLLGTWNSQSRPDRQVLGQRSRRDSGVRLTSSSLKRRPSTQGRRPSFQSRRPSFQGRRPSLQSLERLASFSFKGRSPVDVNISVPVPSSGRE